MSRPRALTLWLCGAALLVAGCEQLGNPEQFATGPTSWRDARGRLVTTTRSFKNENTIRRLVSEGMDHLDYSDPSIGPSQVLTIVVVVPGLLRVTQSPEVTLVTTFQLPDRRPITRRWRAPAKSDRWSAAFALPEPPLAAVTSVGP